MKQVLLSWSSGKDSAWALHLLSQRSDLRVCALLTTFNGAANRVAMHAVRRALVEAQAERTGILLWPVELPWPCSNAEYERIMSGVCLKAAADGISAAAFGDLFLQDIRAYRERQMKDTGLELLFPLWRIPTRQLARDMIAAGVKAKITCVDPSKLDASFAGRDYDSEFLESLPPEADPCGENGEFHTFVYDAPVFSRPIEVQAGEIIERDGFVFADFFEAATGFPASGPRSSSPARESASSRGTSETKECKAETTRRP
ncbi:MAG TPA: ATP-binding protein [Bryobacteraceae bacterium]|nr:ATP-binding protein [Bryobacteraceae bacterium]